MADCFIENGTLYPNNIKFKVSSCFFTQIDSTHGYYVVVLEEKYNNNVPSVANRNYKFIADDDTIGSGTAVQPYGVIFLSFVNGSIYTYFPTLTVNGKLYVEENHRTIDSETTMGSQFTFVPYVEDDDDSGDDNNGGRD